MREFELEKNEYNRSMDCSYHQPLISLLHSTKRSLIPREIRLGLAAKGIRLPDHEIVANLRHLLKDGLVSHDKGRWQAYFKNTEMPATEGSTHPRISIPHISEEARTLLSTSQSSLAFSKIQSFSSDDLTSDDRINTLPGPWGNFRALVDYYRDCVRSDGCAEANALLSDLNEKFIFISASGQSFPRPGQSWSISIPLGEHLSRLIQRIGGQGEDSLLILGYPLQVVCVSKEGAPDLHFLKPIFYLPVNCTIGKGALTAQIEEAAYQVNLDWLQHSFNTPDKKRSFLSACGFFANESDGAAMVSNSSCPSIEHLTSTLAAFCAHRLAEPLLSTKVTSHPLQQPISTGIYNRSILIVANRPQYTKTLLRELSQIRDMPDTVLDQSALKFIFREKDVTIQDENISLKHHVADTISLNDGQRHAADSLLNEYLSVVTGPPGTGKSQVVSAVISNAYLQGRSVLFASRNHKAIDAVCDRCRDLQERPLITRCNSHDDPSLRMTFAKAIKQLMEGAIDQNALHKAIRLIDDLLPLLEDRQEKIRLAKVHEDWQERIGNLEQQQAFLEMGLPPECIDALSSIPQKFPVRPLQALASAISQTRKLEAPGSRDPWLAKWLTCIEIIPSWIRLKRALSAFPGITFPQNGFPTPSKLKVLHGNLTFLRDAANYCSLRQEAMALEPGIKKLPDHATLTEAIHALHQRIVELAPHALERRRAGVGGLASGEERETLANLRTVLNDLSTGMVAGSLQSAAYQVLNEQLPRLFNHFPCWAVTSLSVGSRIPMLPAIFDLVVIDEASQSDIPSSIPLLFRARRAGVVGDPQQLTHITGLTRAKDTFLRSRFGLSRLTDQRFSYVDTSLYNLFADTTGVMPVFLKSTYRSVFEIAEYSNELFYGGRLEVETDTSRLPEVPGLKPGLHWTEAEGDVKSGGISGAWCAIEVDIVATQVKALLDNGFRGTLGVVTPFREQANRIRDIIHDGNQRWELLQAVDFEVSTSHGFQGGERDVILFSLCAGPGMPQGALNFLRETANLFNVAVSRARAVLHVIGNQKWASRCGIRHIEKLACPVVTLPPNKRKSEGPWSPYDSPWEQKLCQALLQHGLSPIPQHPVANRRLDLALIRRDLQLDIEVDGASFHRNPDGTRKTDDIWRDIQLIGMGWKVLRFWVYQLREDMDGCVQKILNEWGVSHDG
ncbi:AAA family ATPase [Desulfoprunum benzoelyticum]|uniref:Very-short-patch-repair endonuclease n=1 Tax=Desulfoprunum benzoelyticum TaxID=1506996 RepID=A0A840V711_9BACT|nr:AAA domain-containing protein [Desulfoprunum benzoelyticum]MBB5349539.1 very-short-patch-repair endonuclease [Desulfoprunum benzoelyticum]MBM9531258.1 AAA family ATPase [Desulfoprunum benzoelyticum]